MTFTVKILFKAKLIETDLIKYYIYISLNHWKYSVEKYRYKINEFYIKEQFI